MNRNSVLKHNYKLKKSRLNVSTEVTSKSSRVDSGPLDSAAPSTMQVHSSSMSISSASFKCCG